MHLSVVLGSLLYAFVIPFKLPLTGFAHLVSASICSQASALEFQSNFLLPLPRIARTKDLSGRASFLETEPLYPACRHPQEKSILPSVRGAYGLFFASPPGSTPTEACSVRDGLALLYIGTASAGLGRNNHAENPSR